MSDGHDDRFLADKNRRQRLEQERAEYERVLRYIANLEFPDERAREERSANELFAMWDEDVKKRDPIDPFDHHTRTQPTKGQLEQAKENELDVFLAEVKQRLGHWPRLWESDTPPQVALRRMRGYLRRCWGAGAEDKRDSDWHVHRAREYYHRHAIAMQPTKEQLALTRAMQNSQKRSEILGWRLRLEAYMEDCLDKVPPRTFLESALRYLQDVVNEKWANVRAVKCRTEMCSEPYFFSRKKNTHFCEFHRTGTDEAKSRKRASNRKTWHKQNYRKRKGSAQ